LLDAPRHDAEAERAVLWIAAVRHLLLASRANSGILALEELAQRHRALGRARHRPHDREREVAEHPRRLAHRTLGEVAELEVLEHLLALPPLGQCVNFALTTLFVFANSSTKRFAIASGSPGCDLL
jgi:hypothetical protein